MGPSSPDAAVRKCGCLGAPRQAGGGPAQMPLTGLPPQTTSLGTQERQRELWHPWSSACTGEPRLACGQLPPGDRGSHEETADVSPFLTNQAKATGGGRNLGILGHWQRKWPHGPGKQVNSKDSETRCNPMSRGLQMAGRQPKRCQRGNRRWPEGSRSRLPGRAGELAEKTRPMRAVLLLMRTGGHELMEPTGRQDRPMLDACHRGHHGTLAS